MGLNSETSTMVQPYEGPRYGAFARRAHGWSWQAFPIGMGTGAVYVLLSAVKPHPAWLTKVEIAFYILNMLLFVVNLTMLAAQFILYRRQSLRLITDPVKGVFVPLVVLSFATIIIGTINYAVPAGIVSPTAIYALFWVYLSLSILVCFPMLVIWYNRPHNIETFTPAWAFLIFPLMLTGVISFNVLSVMPASDPRSIAVLLVGYIFQGIGFFMTFFYLAVYVLRIMTTGFMDGHQANGAFVACGPPGFTALALINLGKRARLILPEYGLVSPQAGEIFYATSVMSALLLFGLATFFFVFGVLPYWFKLHKHLHEILGCWALTFPNVGWINTVNTLGDIFGIRGFEKWHLTMTILVVTTWIVLFAFTAVAFWKGKIFMSKDEDIYSDGVCSALEKEKSGDMV
ncbi:malic acid transport protein [Ceratobasidium sp. AG-Ba]|nr:malic acid transport protein [Ceratobasidium sp. AG-Ba]